MTTEMIPEMVTEVITGAVQVEMEVGASEEAIVVTGIEVEGVPGTVEGALGHDLQGERTLLILRMIMASYEFMPLTGGT